MRSVINKPSLLGVGDQSALEIFVQPCVNLLPCLRLSQKPEDLQTCRVVAPLVLQDIAWGGTGSALALPQQGKQINHQRWG